MEKTLPKELPREGRDKSVRAKGDTKEADAVSSNNNFVTYEKILRANHKENTDALRMFYLKVNEGKLRLERGIGGGDGQGGGSNMRVVREGGEDTVWVSGGRGTRGLEVGKGEKDPPKTVTLTSA